MNTSEEHDHLAAPQSLELPLLGMHCSACAVRVERALSKAAGVWGANVNFATTRATVQYDALQTSPQKLRELDTTRFSPKKRLQIMTPRRMETPRNLWRTRKMRRAKPNIADKKRDFWSRWL